jgi:hypothetical protein
MTNAAAANAAIAGNGAAANVADTSSNMVNAAAASQAWHDPFCSRYAILMFEYGRWFLLAALIIGTIGAVAVIVKLFSSKPEGDETGGGNMLQSSIAAFTALIDSLAKAPTWIAMVGAGLVLMWMSGHALPTFCEGTQADSESQEVSDSANGSDSGAANGSDDDESGG